MMWDQRYASETYAYGTEPNDYLVRMAPRLLPGNLLSIGEGEGRNAVWLAQQGFEVTAVDSSRVGLQKAERLAAARGVSLHAVHADLAAFDLQPGSWDNIVSIFCHLPPGLRTDVHRRAVEALRPGGLFLIEAYTPEQLEYATGGPPVAEMMMDLQSLKAELPGLEFLHAEELYREVHEGEFHNGVGAVVQVLARRPG
jgi:SAM-dependent methyltransferase